ncbi:MAG: PfkB family carbohydrate kinase [Hyphomicrobiales bacterium]|jgi:fructokinase|nr:PfkB family carbohydrate kinase [Hyphomicrobiales bacterium]
MIQSETIKASDWAARPSIAGTGLAAVDRIYSSDLKRPIEALGGSCGNVLISLAMLGHAVAPMVAIGDDDQGQFLYDEFAKAGCETQYVFRGGGAGSPVIVEFVDTASATHRFTSTCPETSRSFPRWSSIDDQLVERARSTLDAASVFYTDRISSSILTAMKAAFEAGALVFFEPASADGPLFMQALEFASVIKLADGTIGDRIEDREVRSGAVLIRTHGERGLTVSSGSSRRFFPSTAAPRLVDTCGAGDMVTTGLLDFILTRWTSDRRWSLDDVMEGVGIGQRLAALNCAFTGARGLFFAAGAGYVREILDRGVEGDCGSYVMTLGRYEGY